VKCHHLFTLLFTVICIAVLCGPGCAIKEPNARQGGPGSAFKVGLITSGPVNDHDWNEPAYNGLLEIQKQLPAQVSNEVVDNPSQISAALDGYASSGYNLVFGHGDEYSDPTASEAPKYPKTIFVTTGGTKMGANYGPIDFATAQGTYLQGMEAAFVSKTGKGGFVGGVQNAEVTRAVDAFVAGAKAANPSFKLSIAYIGNWTDTQKAKAQATSMIANGADVLAHNCDAASAGFFQGANAPGVYTFGVNSTQNDQAPNVLSSVNSDIPKTFLYVAQMVKDGKFNGQPIVVGMKQGGLTVVDNPKFASLYTADQKAKLKQAVADIISGKIKLD